MVKRWPELKLEKTRKFSMSRAKAASQETINKYFKELSSLITEHNLRNNPSRIFKLYRSRLKTQSTQKPPHDLSSYWLI
jgi:hypothetical protein